MFTRASLTASFSPLAPGGYHGSNFADGYFHSQWNPMINPTAYAVKPLGVGNTQAPGAFSSASYRQGWVGFNAPGGFPL